MKKFKAAVLIKNKKPLSIKSLFFDAVQPNQMLIKIHYTYICGSQINEWLGHRGKDDYLPHVLGHEASGKIVKIGKNIKNFKENDRVFLSWIPKKKKREFNNPKYYDEGGKPINSGKISTFSTHVLISENFVYKLDSNVPLKFGAFFGCAMPTGAGLALKIEKNISKRNKNSNIIIYGLGGIGLICLKALIHLGYKNIICVDVNKKNLLNAKLFGAKNIIEFSKLNSFFSNNKNILNNIEVGVDCSGSVKAIKEGLKFIKPKGTFIIAGNPKISDKLDINPYDIILGKKLIGTVGGDVDITNNMDLFKKILLSDSSIFNKLFCSNIYKLSEINLAFKDFQRKRILRPLIKL